MTRQRLGLAGIGILAGAFLALALLAVFAGLSSATSTTAVLLDPAVSRARATFEVSSGWLFTLVLLLGAALAIVVAILVHAFGSMTEPDEPRIPLRWLLPLAALSGALLAYGALRAGIGLAGQIERGTVTVSVYRGLLTALVAGAITGGTTAWVVDLFNRRAALGLAGAAWPQSGAAFIKPLARAAAIPILGVVIAATVAVGFSQVLLAVEGNAAVVLFAVVPALILAAGAALAYRK